jgi:DNA helicase-2/ATP-dependent DNA helicase PcrA
MTTNLSCPKCGRPMAMRTSKHGAFYGCTGYREGCKTTIDANDAGKLAAAYAANAGPPLVSAAQLPGPSSSMAISSPAPAVPGPLAAAIAYQSEIRVPGKRMASRFAGTCACGSSFNVGATIIFNDRRVRGCPACEYGVRLERDRLASLAELPKRVREEMGKLTDEQREVAFKYRGGYARLIAAAGSGKTSTFATLVGNLIVNGVPPNRILAMTFTRDGAREMTARLARLFGAALQDVAVGTLHSFSGRWLENHFKQTLLGLEAVRIRNPLDGSGQVDRSRFPAEVHRELPRDPEGLAVQLLGVNPIPWLKLKNPLGVDKKPNYFMAKDYLRAVGWMCANIVAPESEDAEKVEAQFGLAMLQRFYGLYFEAMQALGVSVFDEWVYLAGKLAKESPEFVQSIASQFDYVVVDEAQDNSMAQLILAHKVAEAGKGNLLLIGDVAQSIYTFRGALPEFVLEAEKYTHRAVGTLHLTRNFRSAAPIIELGNAIVEGAKWNISPPAIPGRPDANVPPAAALTVWDPATTVDEGERVAGVCRAVMDALPEKNPHPRPVAVLSRTNGGLGPTEASLLRQQIPYVISNGSGFFNRWEVRVALAHLSLAAGVVSNDIIKLATQAPYRSLGVGFAKQVQERLAQTVAEFEANGKPAPKPDGRAVIYAMRQVMQRSSRYASGGRLFTQDLEAIVNEPGIVSQASRACAYVRDHLRSRGGNNDDVDDNRIENLRVLSEVAVRFESLAELVHYGLIGANAATESNTPAISLSTVHRYKGLEAPGVIIVSAMTGHFPHEKAQDVQGEERRIEYVAVTRARDRLVISTPVWNNRKQLTTYSWMARLARRLLGVAETRDKALEVRPLEWGEGKVEIKVKAPRTGP